MMKIRNSYLISRSLRRFLMASIATMAIMSINSIVDSVLMGQLISPEAVSAIQNVVPVMGFLAALFKIFCKRANRDVPMIP